MKPLWLLRHGPTAASESGAPLGRLDLPASPAAEASWPAVKTELLALGATRVLTSDLSRAKRHALDLGLPCRIVPDLGEQSFGAWEGVPWGRIEGAEAFFADPAHAPPPGGESFADCATRAVRAFREAYEPDQPTLVLAHAGPLRAIVAFFLGMPLERALDLAFPPFALSRLDVYGPARAVLRSHGLCLGLTAPASRPPS
jgi:broad specificity phosphatase PhoE